MFTPMQTPSNNTFGIVDLGDIEVEAGIRLERDGDSRTKDRVLKEQLGLQNPSSVRVHPDPSSRI